MHDIGIVGGKCSVCGTEHKPGDVLTKGEANIVFGFQDVRDANAGKKPSMICIGCWRKQKEKWKDEIQFTVR